MDSFPERLHHNTPGWVKSGALFHVRIRMQANPRWDLVEPSRGEALLSAAKLYHETDKWWCRLFVVMPDHVHALFVFPPHVAMSVTIRNWKRATTRLHGIEWQDNYFDHRIRDADEAAKTWIYLRENPVVKGLCAEADEWAWWWSGTAD